MGLTRSVLHDEIWESTGTDSSDLDTTVLDRMLNLSWWEIQDKLGFREKEGEGSFSTVAGTSAYDVSGISSDVESIQHVTIQNSTEDTWSPLIYKDKQWFMDERDDNAESEDVPEYYTRFGDEIQLFPTPAGIYTVRVKYLKTIADLITSGFPVPQPWHEIIRLGAEARVWYRLGDPARRDDTLRFRDSLVAGMTEVKVKENVSNRAAISLLRAPYP